MASPANPLPPSHPASRVVIIGAGPAGLTAAFELVRRGQTAVVVESDVQVGGISRTVVRDGFRFDIGGHRFFTKVPRVEALWHEILHEGQFILRPRMSRILYRRRFFDYPLKIGNALRGLGLYESARCMLSYAWVRVRPPRDRSSFEGWTASRFGWRLYRTFFKTYTEKVWGVPATEIRADWAAQRIKNLSLLTAVLHALRPSKRSGKVTSLIEQFQYPTLGPGLMWEVCRDKVVEAGCQVVMGDPVTAIRRGPHGAVAVVSGSGVEHECSSVVSSMPISELIMAMDPPAPQDVRDAARSLSYRDFITVALVVPDDAAFPDNWVYIHDPDVKVGRVQNFASWSPHLVTEGKGCVGLEYFVFEGDDMWNAPDDSLVELAIREIDQLGLVPRESVERGFVVRMRKAYPMYDAEYAANVSTIREWLRNEVPNVHPVGRNGMHRYNNQDHSMLTAMLTVDNMFGAAHDVWSVNVDDDYHEEVKGPSREELAAR